MLPHFSVSIAEKNHEESSKESFATSNRAKTNDRKASLLYMFIMDSQHQAKRLKTKIRRGAGSKHV